MKTIVKAIVLCRGTLEFEVPYSWNDNEIEEAIKDRIGSVDWEDGYYDMDYETEDVIEEDEKEPEDNTYSGGIYE